MGALGLRGGGEVRGRDPITEPRLASVSRNDTNSSEKLCPVGISWPGIAVVLLAPAEGGKIPVIHFLSRDLCRASTSSSE